jgi:hypothetical protein
MAFIMLDLVPFTESASARRRFVRPGRGPAYEKEKKMRGSRAAFMSVTASLQRTRRGRRQRSSHLICHYWAGTGQNRPKSELLFSDIIFSGRL